MAEQQGMQVWMDPDRYSKQDLAQIVRQQDMVIGDLEDRGQLPMAVTVPAKAGAAYSIARGDAAMGAKGALAVGVASASLVGSLALETASPLLSKGLREVGEAAVCAFAATAGHEDGMKDAAKREQARLAKEQQAQGGGGAPA